jgi:DNA-binding beta-propeller fold protein YncE
MIQNRILGSNDHKYQIVPQWEKLPHEYRWPETAGVITDSKDNVYVFNRGNYPMIVFNSNGEFIKTWGENIFTRPHGLSKGPDNTIYCSDDGDHTIRQCDLDGNVLLTIGNPGNPAKAFSGTPFNRCTHTALDPETGDIFISDGYKNSKIHKYSADGKLIKSWGEPGVGPGEFNIVHNLAFDANGFLYVCDRENHRIQIFDKNGNYQDQFNNVHRPCAIHIDDRNILYVAELGWATNINRDMPNIGPRISVLNNKGEVLSRIGDMGYGFNLGQFTAPHGICLDSKLNIYVAEVSKTNISHFEIPPEYPRSFQKLIKV